MSRALLAALALLPALALAADTARAQLRDAKGADVGTATLTAAGSDTKISLTLLGLKPGKHGFHLHAAGKCDAPDFKTAGPHYNPGNRKHGHANPEGAHAGDLPNLDVGPDGKGTATVVAKGVTVAELLSREGTALVVHADPDDDRTDPSGNSGARIACGVVGR